MLLLAANLDAGPTARIDPGRHPLNVPQLPTRSMMEAPTLLHATPSDRQGVFWLPVHVREPLPLQDDARESWENNLPNCP